MSAQLAWRTTSTRIWEKCTGSPAFAHAFNLADEVVTRGATEVWEFVNALNPGHMMEANGMPHPIHIHGTQFTVLGRSTLPELQKLQDGTRDGLVDTGLHDTVLVMPGESVKLLMQFNEAGRFLFHCHNLEHESQGMMRNVDVRA